MSPVFEGQPSSLWVKRVLLNSVTLLCILSTSKRKTNAVILIETCSDSNFPAFLFNSSDSIFHVASSSLYADWLNMVCVDISVAQEGAVSQLSIPFNSRTLLKHSVVYVFDFLRSISCIQRARYFCGSLFFFLGKCLKLVWYTRGDWEANTAITEPMP